MAPKGFEPISSAKPVQYQLSYEATQFGAGQIVELIRFMSIVLGQFVSLILSIQEVLIVREILAVTQ